MTGKDTIIMSTKELKRVPVIHNVIDGKLYIYNKNTQLKYKVIDK